MLLQVLVECGDSREEPVPVAIETARGLLVAALRASGRPVYAINPFSASRYRDRHSASGPLPSVAQYDELLAHPPSTGTRGA